MKPKDYYLLLGVNKHSSKEEIKQNYRKLAKKYHPDANVGSPEAEEVFKSLTIAYDTLMDKEKKKKYDRSVARYGYGSVPKGTQVTKNKDTAKEILLSIIGFGKDAKKALESTTESIKEKIAASKEPKKGENVEASLEITLEEGYFGAEKKVSLKTVGGKINNYAVQVPRGIRNSEKIRLAALGKPGKNGGKNGDLIITVKMKDHPTLKIDGVDIHTSINISYAQSVVGDNIKLRIFGEQVDVNIPKGTLSQDKLIIPKNGYIGPDNTRGNLVLHFFVMPPDEITERERKIYEQLLRVEKQRIKDTNKHNSN